MLPKKVTYLIFIPTFVFLILLSQSCRSVQNFFQSIDEEKNCGGDCKASAFEEIPSPDGKMKAVLFKIKCPEGGGAKCPDGIGSSSLSIMSIDENLSPVERKGNAVDWGSNLEVKWIGDRELLAASDYALGKDQPNVFTVQGVTVRYGKFQNKVELISEVPSPDGKEKAFLYHRVCKHPDSDQLEINTIEADIYGDGYTYKFPPNRQPSCEKGNLYGTGSDSKINLKWNGNNELLIIGSDPDGEKQLRFKKIKGIAVKYQKAE
jgi:hypothetical protein